MFSSFQLPFGPAKEASAYAKIAKITKMANNLKFIAYFCNSSASTVKNERQDSNKAVVDSAMVYYYDLKKKSSFAIIIDLCLSMDYFCVLYNNNKPHSR